MRGGHSSTTSCLAAVDPDAGWLRGVFAVAWNRKEAVLPIFVFIPDRYTLQPVVSHRLTANRDPPYSSKADIGAMR